MRPPQRLGLLLLSGVIAFGCTEANHRNEGDDPGECADGADNDRDGDYDCDDSECAGSPDCRSLKPTADTDTVTVNTTTTTTTSSTTTTTTTQTGSGAAEIDMLLYPTCSGGDWSYYAETLGWTNGDNLVNAWETGNQNGWNEEHGLPSVDFAPDGSWDALEQVLWSGASVADFTPDTNTVFMCGIHDIDPVMTFAIRVYDIDGNFSDCAIFSSDINNDGVQDVYSGQAPSHNPVSQASEVSAANCIEWNVV